MENLDLFINIYAAAITVIFMVIAVVLNNRNKKLIAELDETNRSLGAHSDALFLRNKEIQILNSKLDSAGVVIKDLQKANKTLLEKASDDITVNIKGDDFDIDKIVTQRSKTKKRNGRSTSSNGKTNKEGKGPGNGTAPVKN